MVHREAEGWTPGGSLHLVGRQRGASGSPVDSSATITLGSATTGSADSREHRRPVDQGGTLVATRSGRFRMRERRPELSAHFPPGRSRPVMALRIVVTLH